MVDARHIEKELDDSPEPRAQIAAADTILLNKTDLVSTAELEHLEARIRKMNALTHIYRTERSQIDPGKILNVKARDLSAPFVVSVAQHDSGHHDHGHDHPTLHAHGEDEDHDHHHEHNDEIASFYLSEERPLDLKKVEAWLSEVMNTMGENLYRSKGILHIKGQAKRVVFQGVQTMFEALPDRFWNTNEKRLSQMVFIGKDLNEAKIRSGFQNCLAA